MEEHKHKTYDKHKKYHKSIIKKKLPEFDDKHKKKPWKTQHNLPRND